MPSGQPRHQLVELRSYKCSEGHIFFDERTAQGDRDPVGCFRPSCRGTLRRLRDIEKPPTRIA